MLWGGAVADPADQKRQTATLRALNAKLHRDERIALSLLPLGDGLTLARRRPC
jgi:caffeoyl-CoA O-methyltransferase